MLRFALLVAAVTALAIAVCEAARRARRRTRMRRTLELWRNTPSALRAAALQGQLAADHRVAAAWYLLGSLHAQSGDFATAARMFGMAYHADPDLASAALLTFTCLKSAYEAGSPATERLAETWNEMERPPIGESDLERAVWSALDGDRGAHACEPLERLARIVFPSPV